MAGNAPNSAPASAAPLDDFVARIETALNQIIRAGGFALKVKTEKLPALSPGVQEGDSPEWRVELSGPDSALVLECHAALLDALASVACKAARLEESQHRRIAFDCENYRKSRALELKLMAEMAAERVAASGEPFEMNPMNSAERRLVHLALQNKPQVRSESTGAGHERKVVILPTPPPKRK